jgi:hypothetical protein
MSIQDWGAIGELIGGFAVIVTLLYLALQIRQNTHTVRLSTSHAVTEEFRGMFELLATHRDLCELVTKAATEGKVNGVDKTQYYVYISNFFRAFENAFVQWRNGALDTGQWEGMKHMLIDNWQIPAVREYWYDRNHWYSTQFQQFLETDIMPRAPREGVPLPGGHLSSNQD